MSHTATSPVALPAGPSIPAVASRAVRMGGGIVQPLGKHSGGATPHPHSWASSTVSVYPPDYNVDNRAASTLNSDDARDEGDPFKPKNLFFLSLPLALPDTNAAGAYSLPRPSPRLGRYSYRAENMTKVEAAELAELE